MASRDDKAKQRMLDQQQQQYNAQYGRTSALAEASLGQDRGAMQQLANQYLQQQQEDRGRQLGYEQQLAQPGELETRLSSEATNWLDKTKAGSGVDRSDLGIDHSGLYESAARKRNAERTATGAQQFGAATANPNLQAMLMQQSENQAGERFGASQAQAFDQKDANMRGQANALMGSRNSRVGQLYGATSAAQGGALSQLYGTTSGMASGGLQSLMGNSGNMASNATQNYANFKPRTALDTLAPFITAAIGGASSIATGGMSSLGGRAMKLPNIRNNPVTIRTPNVPPGFVPGGGR